VTETEELSLTLHFQVLLSCGNSYETEAFMVFYQGWVLAFNFSC